MQQLSKQIAQDGNFVLNFQATDKNIANYNSSGTALGQIELLGQSGNINAFIDDNTLVVKNAFIPLTGTTRILNAETGMIGIPEFTEQKRIKRIKYFIG